MPDFRGLLSMSVCRGLFAILVICGLANRATADTITFKGIISQSTQDGTGPAVNNPSLNNILDFQAYFVTLVFPGSITSPGLYNLTGSSLTLSDPTAPASESSFDLISLTITANAAFDDISLLGCLTTGSACFLGNQLGANFRILAAGLNSQNVPATGLDQPHPLDLLEDDGTTDIQGSITSYSYTGVPEPSSLVLLGSALAALGITAGRNMRKANQKRRGT